jgi:hypothetical protein
MINNSKIVQGNMMTAGVASQENFLVNFLLAGFSGTIAKTTVAPTERIKLIL